MTPVVTSVLQNVRLINLAVSLGGVESLISHPASMTHGPMIMTDAEREAGNITPGFIRLRYVFFGRLSIILLYSSRSLRLNTQQCKRRAKGR